MASVRIAAPVTQDKTPNIIPDFSPFSYSSQFAKKLLGI
jgi:hypothetical protein